MSTLLLFFIVCFNFLSILCGLAQGYGTPYTTVLIADVDATTTTIPVSSTVGFASADFLWIDNERIAYAGTDATDFLDATRGAVDNNGLGGEPADHSAGAQAYTEGMNALNSIVGFNYTALQTSYGTLIAVIMSTAGYISSIPRYVFWNVGFMAGSGWSVIKLVILYPLSAAFMLAFLFFCYQLFWMLKPAAV